MRYYFLKVAALFAALSLVTSLSAQYITTVAGNGVSACFQNDQPALCTPFSYPESVCVAPNGDLYITCGNSIKKLTATTGIVTRFAGSDSPGSSGDGGPAINALFQFTRAVRMGKSGNLYIAEYAGNRVRKINMSTGIITTIAGNSTGGYSGDGGPASSASINEPWDLSVDANENVYIADFLNSRIRKVNAVTGIITTIAGTGVASHSGDGGLATNAGIPYPNSICHDSKGNLYISETLSGNTCRIRKVDAATGIITTIAGNDLYAYSGDGGPAVDASLFDPDAVLADPLGNIYIAEYDDSRIRKIDAATGIINTIAGTGVNGFSGDNGLAINATLYYPMGLALDNAGNLFVCDNQNLRVRKIFLNATAPPVITPGIKISASAITVCNATTITFTATTTNAGASPSYIWYKNGVAVGDNSPVYSSTGLQSGDIISCTLSVILCASTTTALSNSITLTGGTTGPSSISIVASATTICKNQNVTFTASRVNEGANPAYQWKLNGNNVGTNDTVYTNASLANGDVISCVLTVAAALPCSSGGSFFSGNIIMKVNTSPAPSISIAPSVNDICPGTPVSFSTLAQNAGPSPTYQWKLNGANAGNNTDSYSNGRLADNDQVMCTIIPDNTCSAPVSSNIVTLIVKSLPAISLYPPDTTVNAGSQVQLRATINGPVSLYTWSPLQGLANANNLSPATIPLLNNTVYIFSIITAGGCSDSVKAVIKVQQKLFMPNAFTPNNDGINDIFRIPPNTSLALKDFVIYNRWGEKIFSTTNINTGWDGTVKSVLQEAGAYTFIIRGKDNKGPVFVKGMFVLIR